MAVSYNRLWKLLIDKKNEQSRTSESLWYVPEHNDKTDPGRTGHVSFP